MSLRDFVITSVGCSTLTLGIVITVLLHVIFICVYDNEVLFPFSGFQFLVAEYDYKSYCYYGMSSFRTFVFFFLRGSFLARFGIGGVGGWTNSVDEFPNNNKNIPNKILFIRFCLDFPDKNRHTKKAWINQFVLAKLFGLKWVDSGKTW